MALQIDDAKLEKALADLGQRQVVPVNKTAMARAILLIAVDAARRTKDPHAWRPPNVQETK